MSNFVLPPAGTNLLRRGDIDFVLRLLVFGDFKVSVRAAVLRLCFDVVGTERRFFRERKLTVECAVL